MTAPNYAGLTQLGLTAAKMLVINAFIGPVNLAYNANTGVNGGWTPLGRIQPGTYDNDFTRTYYDVKAGLPETPNESFVTELKGNVKMNIIEPTAKIYEVANGGDPGIPIFNAAPYTTTVQSTIAPPPAPTVTTAATGGTVLAGTYICATTYTNAAGETTRSGETPITTTGATSTITVDSGAMPVGVTGVKVYITAVGGASGSEKLQGTYTTAPASYTLTAPPATVTALPGSNTTGPASTAEIVNIVDASTWPVTGQNSVIGLFVQATTAAGTEYSQIIAVNTTGQDYVQVFPRFSGVPTNGSTFKVVDAWEEPLGTATIAYYAFRTIALATDGSQIVTYSPKVRFNGVKDNMPQGKEMFVPLDAMLYSYNDANYNGPVLGKKFILSPRMALSYVA